MAKINIILIVSFWAVFSGVSAQNYKYGYLVEFTDKDSSSYSVERPREFLSQRAINRRTKFQIGISESDLPVNSFYIDSITGYGAVFHVASRWFNSAVYFTNSSLFSNKVPLCSFVKNVTLVFRGNPLKKNAAGSKWSTEIDTAIYGQSSNQIVMARANMLHARGFWGSGVHIAVLDAGFWRANEYACFDSLFLNNRILGTWDFVARNYNVFDDASHGMSVLSIMGGNLPYELMGTAPQASYYLYRTENVSSEYPVEEENWIAAAERADSAGADIITASLGYTVFNDADMNYTYADMDGKSTRITRGAEAAFLKGMVVVNSAGNEGSTGWRHIVAPSDGEHVICVGAVNGNQQIGSFSSRGPSYDGRIKPDVVAKGVATTRLSTNGTVGRGNGTSYSCPVITGMVACLWQALPDYTNRQIVSMVRNIGNRYSNPNNDYGFGVPDFGKALFVVDSLNYQGGASDKIVKVYPVPFYDNLSFHVFVARGQEVEVALFDIKGAKIYSQKQQVKPASYNYFELNGLSEIGRGLYILAVYTQSGVLTQKIVGN